MTGRTSPDAEPEDNALFAWGSGTSPEEIAAAFRAICDGYPMSTLVRLLHEGGWFVGFEVAGEDSSDVVATHVHLPRTRGLS